ncbi:Annexin C1 [Psilocybe cubensis]|uniref:Annexin C1 n=2 Tax=Psilocybe cubensis TaxID=181762 RepID=A0ACB8HEJ9_PSICU|nr:Annexin C1 [Psilocybe cubensis]KAH9486150.1 Annexin C1 [Psilocybe cubensis]
MSSAPPNPSGGYAPPPGPPPSTTPASQSPYPPPAGAPPPPSGQQQQQQQPYSVYPPPGAYAAGPPPVGGYYPPPPPGGYYPQYPQYPGYYPPPPAPGQYAPYPPPPGQYPPPAAQYPPPAGSYPPPPGGAPGTPGAPGAPGAPAAGAGAGAPPAPAPATGQYPPPTGPPPPGTAPYAMPTAGTGAPYLPPGGSAPYYPPPPPTAHAPQDPLVYLGAAIPNPEAPPVPLGVQKVHGWDPAHDYNSIVRAISPDGVGDEKRLLNIVLPLNIFQMDALSDYCLAKTGVTLAEKLQRCTSGNFSTTIHALALGPLFYDVHLAKKAIAGLGTDETLLIELILGRQAFEVRWLKTAYRVRYGRDLGDAVRGDLSGATLEMFNMALAAQKPTNPYTPPTKDDPSVVLDAKRLHEAVKRKQKGWEVVLFEIFINRSDLHIAAVSLLHCFIPSTHSPTLTPIPPSHPTHPPLPPHSSSTIREALLYILHGVKSKRDGHGFWRDAKLLEKSMAGLGTRDAQLIYRLVRAHWDGRRLEGVKEAYARRYRKGLEGRVRGETSGSYREVLGGIVRGREGMGGGKF